MKYGARGEKAYLSAILDLKSRDIVSFAIGRHNNNQLVFETFNLAIQKYPDAHPLFHSDRGFQYTSKQFKDMLEKQGMRQSMSRVGRCIDNGTKIRGYTRNRYGDFNGGLCSCFR